MENEQLHWLAQQAFLKLNTYCNKGSSNISYGFTNPNNIQMDGSVFSQRQGVQILRGMKNMYAPKYHILFQYFITLFFHCKFFSSSYKCDIPIGKLSIRNKFYG